MKSTTAVGLMGVMMASTAATLIAITGGAPDGSSLPLGAAVPDGTTVLSAPPTSVGATSHDNTPVEKVRPADSTGSAPEQAEHGSASGSGLEPRAVSGGRNHGPPKAAVAPTTSATTTVAPTTPTTSVAPTTTTAVAPTTTTAVAPSAATAVGVASWYGAESGGVTASGERFNPNDMTAAHRTLRFGTQVRVCRASGTRACVVVRINDRGPFAHGRVIDLSQAAMAAIGGIDAGAVRVSLEVLS